MRRYLTIATLLAASLSLQARAGDLHNVIVGAAAGAAGAAIGQSVGGQDGAIIGGAIGGATGAVLAAKNGSRTVIRERDDRHGYHRPHGKAWGHKKHWRRGHDRHDD